MMKPSGSIFVRTAPCTWIRIAVCKSMHATHKIGTSNKLFRARRMAGIMFQGRSPGIPAKTSQSNRYGTRRYQGWLELQTDDIIQKRELPDVRAQEDESEIVRRCAR